MVRVHRRARQIAEYRFEPVQTRFLMLAFDQANDQDKRRHPCARQMVKYHPNDRDVCSFVRACIDRDKSVLTGSNAVFIRIRHDVIRHFPIIDFVP